MKWIKNNKEIIGTGLHLIAILIASIALYQTSESLSGAEASFKLAEEEYRLRLKQYEEQNFRDSVEFVNSVKKDSLIINLSRKQISAISEQVKSLKLENTYTDLVHRPKIEIQKFGIFEKGRSDSIFIAVQIKNYGSRPAIVKKLTVHTFDEDFNILFTSDVDMNSRLVGNIVTWSQLQFVDERATQPQFYNVNDIHHILNKYFVVNIDFVDEHMNRPMSTKNGNMTYRWDRIALSQSPSIILDDGSRYYPFNHCNESERKQLLSLMKLMNIE